MQFFDLVHGPLASHPKYIGDPDGGLHGLKALVDAEATTPKA
jgi:hypothetical protein